MAAANEHPPIIVRRITKKGGGHHGGAWKVAFADFAVAMMAFFLVLWLSASTTEEQKDAISGYFQDPVGFVDGGSANPVDLGGTMRMRVIEAEPPGAADQAVLEMRQDQVEQLARDLERQRLQELKNEIENRLAENEQLREFSDQIILDVTEDGLRIQIIDRQGRPMFDQGDAQLYDYSEDLLHELAIAIAKVPNRLSISGHTDARPYSGRGGYSNWELSSDRANAARRALTEGGLPPARVARVVGRADSSPLDLADPYAAVNRRISILILNRDAEAELQDQRPPEGTTAPPPSGQEPRPSRPAAAKPLTGPGSIFELDLGNLNLDRAVPSPASSRESLQPVEPAPSARPPAVSPPLTAPVTAPASAKNPESSATTPRPATEAESEAKSQQEELAW